jgi:predicted MFS family arabinose efflux permease
VTRDLRLLSVALLFWGVGEGLFFYFQPLYLQQLGADPVRIGAILGAAGVAAVLTHIPAGSISDRLGTKSAINASWILGAASAWAMYLAPNLTWFVVGLVAYYLTLFVMSPMSSYITSMRGNWPAARALTTTYSFFSLGLILGPVVGGNLGQVIGLRTIFAVSGVLFILSTSFVLRLSPQPTLPRVAGQGAWQILKQPGLARLLAIIFFGLFAMTLGWPLIPNFLSDQRGLTLSALGALGSVNAIGIVALNLSIGRLRPRLGFILTHLVVALSVISIWSGTGFVWYALGFLLFGGFRTAHALAVAQAEPLVDRRHLGLTYGLVETMIGAAMAISSALAGLLYGTRPWLPFPASLVLTALGLAISLIFLPKGPAVSLPAAAEIAPSLPRQ